MHGKCMYVCTYVCMYSCYISVLVSGLPSQRLAAHTQWFCKVLSGIRYLGWIQPWKALFWVVYGLGLSLRSRLLHRNIKPQAVPQPPRPQPQVVNFVSGRGRDTMPPCMEPPRASGCLGLGLTDHEGISGFF